jgi:hypothetical protein
MPTRIELAEFWFIYCLLSLQILQDIPGRHKDLRHKRQVVPKPANFSRASPSARHGLARASAGATARKGVVAT